MKEIIRYAVLASLLFVALIPTYRDFWVEWVIESMLVSSLVVSWLVLLVYLITDTDDEHTL